MKKLFFTLTALMLVFGSTIAQKNFEGSVTFGMKMLGEGADQFAAFAPTGTSYSFRGGDIRVVIEGGMAAAMMGPIVVKGETGESYMIKDAEQAVYKFEAGDKKEEGAKPEVTKEDEVITILGYKCQKYKVVSNDVETYMWTTKDIKIEKPKKTAGQAGQLFIDGLDGFPLKIMTTADAMGMTITTIMTAKEIDKSKPSKDLFEIPANYTEKDGAALMGGMMGK